MTRYTIADLEKALAFLKKEGQTMYVQIEIGELGRMIINSGDMSGNRVTITVYEESTAKMPDVTRTERL